MDEYHVTIPAPYVRVTSQINCGDATMLSAKKEPSLYPLYTEPATFAPPSCDHETDQVATGRSKEAAWLPWSFKGGTQVVHVQQSPWTPWSPSSFERVQTSHRKVGEEVGRPSVAQMRQGGAAASPWLQNGCTIVGQ